MTPEELQSERRRRIQETFQLDPALTLNIRGRDLKLELNNFAAKGILKDVGLNILRTGLTRADVEDPDTLSAVVYWCLLTYQPDITKEDVDKLISYRHLPAIVGTLMQAVDMFMPDLRDLEAAGSPVPIEDAEKELDPTLRPAAVG